MSCLSTVEFDKSGRPPILPTTLPVKRPTFDIEGGSVPCEGGTADGADGSADGPGAAAATALGGCPFGPHAFEGEPSLGSLG